MRYTGKLVLVLFAAVTLLAFGTLATADDEKPQEGDRLVERWWQHAASFSNALSPIADKSGASCQLGQNGKIWFLHGTSGNAGPVVRTCTIPTGKKLFFPIVNNVCIPFPGETIEQNVQACKDFIDQVDVRELEVDGKERNRLIRRRTQPSGFALTLPEDNIFDFPDLKFDTPAGVYVGVADGFWALLKPLAAGDHTIHIKGGITGGFAVDVTYNLKVVEPGPIVPRE